MMIGALLDVTDLVKRFGGLVATDHVSFDVRQREIHAIIGPNGAGKTTLLDQLGGEMRPDSGTIRLSGEDITALPAYARAKRGIGRSFQITSIFRDFTVVENVALAAQIHRGHSFRFWRQTRDDADLRRAACEICDRLGLGNRLDVPADLLAHGEKRILEIAVTLAAKPVLLLLDEPTAGAGTEESARISRLLKTLKGQVAILLVEHDMDVIFEVADRITVLVSGQVAATGAPQDIRQNAEVRRAYLGDDV